MKSSRVTGISHRKALSGWWISKGSLSNRHTVYRQIDDTDQYESFNITVNRVDMVV